MIGPSHRYEGTMAAIDALTPEKAKALLTLIAKYQITLSVCAAGNWTAMTMFTGRSWAIRRQSTPLQAVELLVLQIEQ